MMLITFLVLVLLILQTQHGGAVYILEGGSGKFTRVHFKGNTATNVSKLLIVTILLSVIEIS